MNKTSRKIDAPHSLAEIRIFGNLKANFDFFPNQIIIKNTPHPQIVIKNPNPKNTNNMIEILEIFSYIFWVLAYSIPKA